MPNDTLPIVRTGMAPASLAEAMKFAEVVAASDMVPAQFKGKPGNVLVAIQWGAEVGLGPLQALQNIAVINGRPSIFGDAALALVRGSPVCVDVIETFDRGDGTPDRFTAICTAKRKNAEDVVRTFSVGDAKKAGLWGKQGPWQTYPKRMLQQRARGFALRDAFPDVLRGVITVEEAQDIPGPAGAKNITPAAVPPRVDLADEPPLEPEQAPDRSPGQAAAPEVRNAAAPEPPEPENPPSREAPAEPGLIPSTMDPEKAEAYGRWRERIEKADKAELAKMRADIDEFMDTADPLTRAVLGLIAARERALAVRR